jgi:hypothetical protein
VARAAHQVDSSWSATGSTAGSTLTLAMVTGRLLTIANVGDSTGMLDTGACHWHAPPALQWRLGAVGLMDAPSMSLSPARQLYSHLRLPD